jgi:hypothetical protein
MSPLAWDILALFVSQTKKTYHGEWGHGYIASWTLGEILGGKIDAAYVKICPETPEEKALKELVDLGLVEEVPKLGERFRLVVKE